MSWVARRQSFGTQNGKVDTSSRDEAPIREIEGRIATLETQLESTISAEDLVGSARINAQLEVLHSHLPPPAVSPTLNQISEDEESTAESGGNSVPEICTAMMDRLEVLDVFTTEGIFRVPGELAHSTALRYEMRYDAYVCAEIRLSVVVFAAPRIRR